MGFNRKTHRLYVQAVIVALFVTAASVQAQTIDKGPVATPIHKQEKEGDAQTGEKTDEVEKLKSRVERLQSLVEQQQRVLADMQRQLDDMNGKARLTVAASSSKPDGSLGSSTATLTSAPGEASQSPEKATAASASKPQDKPVILAGWDENHAFLRSADGALETRLTGYGQLDFRGYQKGDHPANTVLIRRARLAVEGKLRRYFDFRLEGDFADTSSTLLRDFYVRIHRIDEFQMTFGQVRVPISQEELRTDSYQDFVERSMVNNLVPSRSPGLMASGVIDKGVFEYQVGSFNGKGLLEPNNNGTPETAFRVRFTPLKNRGDFATRGLSFGGAFTQGRSLGGSSVRGITESRSFSFFVPDTINGKYVRANGEMTWMLGPAALRAEYDQTNQRRDNLGPGGRNLPAVIAKGYTAQFTYLVTGEEKPEAGGVTPRRNLFGDGNGNEGFGAWELKFRYANLQISDATAKSNRAESFYFGPNWYLNRFVRYVLDLGIERFKDPLRAPRPGDRNFFVILSRVQVAF